MKGKEIIEMLKGFENYDVEMNVKFLGRSITITAEERIYLETIDEYNKGYLCVDTGSLNYGFDFDDGKGNLWKKKR